MKRKHVVDWIVHNTATCMYSCMEPSLFLRCSIQRMRQSRSLSRCSWLRIEKAHWSIVLLMECALKTPSSQSTASRQLVSCSTIQVRTYCPQNGGSPRRDAADCAKLLRWSLILQQQASWVLFEIAGASPSFQGRVVSWSASTEQKCWQAVSHVRNWLESSENKPT